MLIIDTSLFRKTQWQIRNKNAAVPTAAVKTIPEKLLSQSDMVT